MYFALSRALRAFFVGRNEVLVTWSEMRKKLEQEYLADCLRGRIQYFITHYRKDHDDGGRACIRLDGEEILCGDWFAACRHCWPSALDDELLDLGAFDHGSFKCAFRRFDNQSIEESLQSDDLLIRIFAILDRRVGKRRLEQMRKSIQEEPAHFQAFYMLRMEAEGLLQGSITPKEF